MTQQNKKPNLNLNINPDDVNPVSINCFDNILVVPEAKKKVLSIDFDRTRHFDNSCNRSDSGFFSFGTYPNISMSLNQISEKIESFPFLNSSQTKLKISAEIANQTNFSIENSIDNKNPSLNAKEKNIHEKIRPLIQSFFESKESSQNLIEKTTPNTNSQHFECNEKNKNQSENEPKIANKLSKCTCKKSFCLRLYCDCFSKKMLCGPECSCVGCYNNTTNFEFRESIMKDTVDKNPLAFASKYKNIKGDNKILHSRGCNCSKTNCLKKYCECFNAKTGCTRLCRCTNCKNDNIDIKDSDIKVYYEKVLRKRKKQTTLNLLCEQKMEHDKK